MPAKPEPQSLAFRTRGKPVNEFEFIADMLRGLSGPEGLSLLDDVALWKAPRGRQAVFSMDTLVEGVHFEDGRIDQTLGEKLIRVNISDIGAKGAKAHGYFLSLSLPQTLSPIALANFCDGLLNAQNDYDITLWGGDTTRSPGPLVLTLCIVGSVPKGKMVLRSNAKPGDLLCVSGTIGDSYLGLQSALNPNDKKTINSELYDKYLKPSPPYHAYSAIRKFANASLDISDGLLADCRHLADASHVQAEIHLTSVPLSPLAQSWVLSQDDYKEAKLKLFAGGDDYQVLLSVSPKYIDKITKEFSEKGFKLSVIGKIKSGSGVKCLDATGQDIPITDWGYTHF